MVKQFFAMFLAMSFVGVAVAQEPTKGKKPGEQDKEMTTKKPGEQDKNDQNKNNNEQKKK
jgi:hypothetical protein